MLSDFSQEVRRNRPGLMFASPVSRARSHNAMKGSGERRLIPESGLRRHITKRKFSLNQKFLRTIDALVDQPLVARNAKGGFE